MTHSNFHTSLSAEVCAEVASELVNSIPELQAAVTAQRSAAIAASPLKDQARVRHKHQLLTMQEVSAQLDEARLAVEKATQAPQEERQALEAHVQLLEQLLQEVRAEYVAEYEREDEHKASKLEYGTSGRLSNTMQTNKSWNATVRTVRSGGSELSDESGDDIAIADAIAAGATTAHSANL